MKHGASRRQKSKRAPRFFELVVTTWVRFAIGATHYYGRIRESGKGFVDSMELERLLSAKEARELTEKDNNGLIQSKLFRYRAGQMTFRFNNKDEVETFALKWFRQNALPDDVLFSESDGYCNPCAVLAGPSWFRREASTLYAEAEANNFWKGDQQKMREISDRWDCLVKRLERPRGRLCS